MIRSYLRKNKDNEFKRLENIEKDSFIYVESPSEKELILLSEKLGLDKSILIDAVDKHEIPRIEVEGFITYIFTRFAYIKADQIKTSPILIILSGENITVITLEAFPRIETILESKPITSQQVKLMINFMIQIQETYNHALNIISKNVRVFTFQLEKITNKDIVKFVLFENDLHDFNLALVKTNNDLNSILSGKTFEVSQTEHDKIEDLYLGNSQLIDICNENIRTIANLREAYSTIITNNLNRIIKLFTSLTVILTLPTIISSFFGMNVILPNLTFPQIVFSTTIICISALIIFIYKDWL